MARGNKVIFLTFGLLAFGLLMVYDASSAAGVKDFNDKYFFLKEQAKWIVLGLVAAAAAFFFDYRRLKIIALPALLVSLLLLIAVFLPGVGVRAYGASRWINLGFTVFQPSELAKLSLIVYLSAWLTTKEKGRLPSFLVLVGLLVLLIILEPDMGTAIVLFLTALIIYFLSESRILGLLFLLPLIVFGGLGLVMTSPYRLRRLLTFFNPDVDPLGASYHIRQALIAVGSGGIWGLGLGSSRQKYSYLPEATTDSIFAIIGEELGLIGASTLLFIFMLLFYLAVQATLEVEDKFGRTLGLGIITWLAVQTLINISSIVALIPLTGVPLPFISYGGSALVTEMAAMGVLASIWRANR